MKKIYISIFIFLLLIALSSFSYCADEISISSYEYDITNYDKTTFYEFAINKVKSYYADVETQKYFLLHRNENNFTAIYFFDDYYFNLASTNIYTLCTLNDVAHTSYIMYSGGSWDGYANYKYNFPIARLNVETKQFVTTYDNTLILSQVAFNFDMILKNYNGELIYNSNVSSDGLVFGSNEYPVYPDESGGEGEGGEGEGGEGEGGEGGTDENGILDFITNFWDNLIHIVVPTSEQWTEVQNSWQADILDKFNIQTWSFSSSSLDYENSNFWSNYNVPTLYFSAFGNTCEIDLQYIHDLLNTPLSFGRKYGYYGDSSQVTTIINIDNTSGVTLKDILLFVLAIDITLMNIALYNKFFNKGGDD